VETAAAPCRKNKGYTSTLLNLFDQLQALVWMNSMLVLLEQAADVVCPSLVYLFVFHNPRHRRVSTWGVKTNF